MDPEHDLEPDPGPARTEDPLEQQGQHEEDVQSDGLHCIEPDVSAQTRVPDHPQVEGKEGHERGVGDGPVEGEEREERIEEGAQRWVLVEEEAAVLERVEEGESVSHR